MSNLANEPDDAFVEALFRRQSLVDLQALNFGAIRQAEFMLSAGEAIQRLVVVRQLPDLFREDEEQCLLKIIPMIQREMRKSDVYFHAEVAASFLQLLQNRLITPLDFAVSHLPHIFGYMEQGQKDIYEVWNKFLLELIDFLPPDTIKNEILPFTINQCPLPLYFQRIGSAKLLGRMCSRLDKVTVTQDVLPLILALIQDNNAKVRAATCKQLDLVAKELPEDAIKSSIVPNLIDLARDIDVSVRSEAVEVTARMLPFLPRPTIRASIIPLVMSISRNILSLIDDSVVSLATAYPNFCHGMYDLLTEVEIMNMVAVFCDLMSLGSTISKKPAFAPYIDEETAEKITDECRLICAQNFPKMLRFNNSAKIVKKYMRVFPEILPNDTIPVRKAYAANMYKITGLLGQDMACGMKLFVRSLKDTNMEVVASAAPIISNMACYVIENYTEKDNVRLEFAAAICHSATHAEQGLNWRTYEEICRQMACMVRVMPSEYVYQKALPIIFKAVLKSRFRPVRLTALRTLLVYLRYNLKSSQRQKMRERMVNMSLASCCHERMLYLKLCEIAIPMFSCEYICTYFLSAMLTLGHDRVANNRLVFANLLPEVFLVISGTDKFETDLTGMLKNWSDIETDSDVMEALINATFKISDYRAKGEKPDSKKNAKKLEEERRLGSIVANRVALTTKASTTPRKKCAGAKNRFTTLHKQNMPIFTPVPFPSTIRYFDYPKPDVKISSEWLNLETGYYQHKIIITGRADTIFNSVFEREFYRDAGIRMIDLPVQAHTSAVAAAAVKDTKPPPLLAKSGRSKSFVMQSPTEPEAMKRSNATRIPVLGNKGYNRRSMDVSQLSRVNRDRGSMHGRGDGSGTSRLPVRCGKN